MKADFFVIFWTLINGIIPIAIVALIIWYLKIRTNESRQLLDKLDKIIALLENNKSN